MQGNSVLLTEKELSQQLRVSLAGLRRWRAQKQRGPAWRKLGRLVRYHPADVAAWLESRPTGGEGAR